MIHEDFDRLTAARKRRPGLEAEESKG